MLPLLGMLALAKGFQAQSDRNDREAQDWEFQQGQRKRLIQQQKDVADASDPAAVQAVMQKSDDQDNRDVGEAGEAAPTATGQYSVPAVMNGGKTFDSQGGAQAVADAYNSPDAQNERIAGVMKRYDPAGSAKYMSDIAKAKVDTLNARDAEKESPLRDYDRGLAAAAASGGHEGIADFFSQSLGDGHGGNAKASVVDNGDGTVSYSVTKPDGSVVQVPGKFTNDQSGVAQAAYSLSKAVPPDQKVKHVQEQQRIGIAQQQANTQEQYRKDQADWMGRMADAKMAAVDAKSANAVDRMSEIDKLTYQDLNKRIESAEKSLTALQGSGMYMVDSPEILQARNQIGTLQMQQRALAAKYVNGGAPAVDPLGLRSSTAPAASPSPYQIPAGVQATRDAVAGKMVIDDTFKGNANDARAWAQGVLSSPAGAGDANAMERAQAQRVMAALNASPKPPAPPAPTPAPAPAAPAPAPRPAASMQQIARIPDPPPAKIQMGLQMVPNPAYAKWAQQYDPKAYAAQQSAEQTRQAQAASSARTAFNPYAFNRVP